LKYQKKTRAPAVTRDEIPDALLVHDRLFEPLLYAFDRKLDVE